MTAFVNASGVIHTVSSLSGSLSTGDASRSRRAKSASAAHVPRRCRKPVSVPPSESQFSSSGSSSNAGVSSVSTRRIGPIVRVSVCEAPGPSV